MRIVSLLPSATEILFALGLEEQVVGVSHACDFPPAARSKPRVTRSRLAPRDLSSAEIAQCIDSLSEQGTGPYELDVDLLASLRPDLIFTQDICDVCAVPHGIIRQALPRLASRPRVYSLEPNGVGDILSAIKTIGDATGRQERARRLIADLRRRIDAITAKTGNLARLPTIACIEWLDPPWSAGHWVPEMVGLAGGADPLGGARRPSRRVTWEEVVRLQPDVFVLMPCGFDLDRTLREVERTRVPRFVNDAPAARAGRVYAVNGSAYFNRPGPRIVDGLEILASIVHPEIFGEPDPSQARRVQLSPA